MTTPEIVLLCVVIGVGCTAALWNITSLALVASYGFGMAVYLWTGGLPIEEQVQFQFLTDCAVIAAIYCKKEAFDCLPYKGLRHQLCAAWLERSYWDRAVVVCFLGMWALYAFAKPQTLYWGLWTLAIIQFLAAAGEAIHDRRTAMRHNRQGESPHAPNVKFRAALGIAGYG